MKEFDYIIIGGGCAGLSLAYELEINEKLKDKTLAIIEPRTEYKKDKTWSFWKVANHNFDDCVKKSWKNFTINIPKKTNHLECVSYPYQSVDSGLFYEKINNKLAENKNISLIGKELKKLSDECRNLKIDKKELFGGSMTITSLGGIGGSYFTPIINYPEVAILGVGKSEKKQVYIDGKFVTRVMLPLSLSYDHRIIDGAEAARFNNDLKENLGKNFAYKLAV